MLRVFEHINPAIPNTLFIMMFIVGVSTSLIISGNSKIYVSFLKTSATYVAHVISLGLVGLLTLGLQLMISSTQISVVISVTLFAISTVMIYYIYRQGILLLEGEKLSSKLRDATFDNLLEYPTHYPVLRKSICDIWANIDDEIVSPKTKREKTLLSEKLLKEFRQTNDRIIFFSQDMNHYLRDLNVADRTGMIKAIEAACKIAVYHPTTLEKNDKNIEIIRQLLHDLIHSCNNLLKQSDNWDIVADNREHEWEVLHGYRVLEVLLIKSIATIDYDFISSSFRMIYTTLLRNHENINNTLFIGNVLNDISIIEWIQDRMDKCLHFLKRGLNEDKNINLKLITYSSIIRICIGRIDKLQFYLQDTGENKPISVRCHNLIDILIEQIHSLSTSEYKFHQKISVALFFLVACFSHFRYSKLSTAQQYVHEIWKKLEYQSRFMIKYHIGGSEHKGLSFFTSYVCLLQFLRYNPIPLIPWKVRNYTFIEINTLMDDLLGYFEKYLVYLDPAIPVWEKEFINKNLSEPSWIFFNSPQVTTDLLEAYMQQFYRPDELIPSVKNKKSYSEFMHDKGGEKSDLKPRFVEETRYDLRSTQIN
ncbi:MAG: hypothetical protein R2883_08635 [Caldisericia bacterium]